ncbi:uncharacterized protein E0L32_008058 [Thyridium curvatum]|uniref:DUF7598 domain-containing protein n=1 Tax=Thyridium curvatum TaxID=1093900 RepID=A0A507B1T0_9PEZI|nr:uncharacterized protein E0L32_008058 [Thyridium curvatum]TPX11021.1 hypothetical protein E0L32_008058 [Thyridium curvatum]
MFKKFSEVSESSKFRGSAIIVLNILRGFNVVGLLSVAIANWVMIVVPPLMKHHFFFFDFASHFFVSGIALFLLISETGLFVNFYKNNFAVLGPDRGFFWLGLAMIMLGCNALANTNKPDFTVEDLGLPLWRMVLAAGILCLIFGFFNFIASLVYRDPQARIAAREFRKDGNLAKGKNYEDMLSQRSASLRDEKETSRARRYTQAFMSKFGGKRPEISHPMPQHVDVERAASSHNDGDSWAQDRGSPIAQGMQRPPTAMHPAFTGGNRATRYSEVSHLNRF